MKQFSTLLIITSLLCCLIPLDAQLTKWTTTGSADITSMLGYSPGNMTNTGAAVVGMVPVATDTSGGSWTPTNNVTLNVNGVVNVKAYPYNAKGDGVTDDTIAISNALKNAVVYFPSGTYWTKGLTTTNGLVYGDGPTSMICMTNPGTAGSLILFDTGNNQTSFENLRLNGGTNLNFDVDGGKIAITGLKHNSGGQSHVFNCFVDGFQYGIQPGANGNAGGDGSRTNQAWYADNTITNCYYGFYCAGKSANGRSCDYIAVNDNIVTLTWIAVYQEGCPNITFTGNVIHDCAYGFKDTFVSTEYSAHSTHVGNTVNHCVYGVYATRCMNGIYRANTFLSSSLHMDSATNYLFEANTTDQFFYMQYNTNGLGNVVKNNLIVGGGNATNIYMPVGNTNAIVVSGNRLAWSNGGENRRLWSGLTGTATVPNGSTNVVVTNFLALVPAVADIQLTPQNSLGSATKYWVSSTSTNNFTISVDQDPGATTAIFTWRHIDN